MMLILILYDTILYTVTDPILHRSWLLQVLSYPLYQSIKSRTYENLQALFSGEVDIHNTFSVQAMPNSPLKLQVLYKPLAELGKYN